MTGSVNTTSLAVHPGPRQGRVRIHGLLPTHRGDELLGRELMVVLPLRTDEVCRLVPWDGGEGGLRFRVHAGGRLDFGAPSDHQVVLHLQARVGVRHFGLTRFETRGGWDNLQLQAPVEVAPYRSKTVHDRPTVSRRVHMTLTVEEATRAAAWLQSIRQDVCFEPEAYRLEELLEEGLTEAGR